MIALFTSNGSTARFVRVDSTIPCPCRTPEGMRDPEWHDVNFANVVCNEQGMLPDPAHTVDIITKAFIQPIQSTRATRLQGEYINEMFGIVHADDHLGIFPVNWNGTRLEFDSWSQSGEDFVEYNGQQFLVVNSNMIPDPVTGNPEHHWEVGLRLIGDVVG